MIEVSAETKETVRKIILKERIIKLSILFVLIIFGYLIFRIYPSDYSLLDTIGSSRTTIEDVKHIFGPPKQHFTEENALTEKLAMLQKESDRDIRQLSEKPDDYSTKESESILYSNRVLSRAENILKNTFVPDGELTILEYDYRGTPVFIFFDCGYYQGAYPGFPKKTNNEQLFWKNLFREYYISFTETSRGSILSLRGSFLAPFR